MGVFSKIYVERKNNMWIIGDLFPPYSFPGFFSAFVLCILSFYIFKKLSGDGNITVRGAVKGHSWTSVQITAKTWYCSVCESLLLNGIGVYCDCCGVCADPDCVKKANFALKCKIITSNDQNQLHHWVKGNLPFGANCKHCLEECSRDPGLVDFRCCWCQMTIHTECLLKVEKVCDFGPFRRMIVPPWCVQTAKRKGALNKHLLLRGVRDPCWEKWTPLVVVANKKSGNGDGALVLSEFRKYLNPVQVIDLSERKPPAALQWCVLLSPKTVNILVAGGDGTVSWMLSTSHKLDLDPEPLLSIIPLGTGNDLSRVLNWGHQNSSELDVEEVLKNIIDAKVSELDRWKVEVISNRHLGLKLPNKTYFMYNYASIGVDAQVALNFHKTRDSIFYIYGSRLFNKMLYLTFGTQQVVTADCKNLEKILDLYLDGKHIDLPELESIVILNISSWGAGVNLWSMVSDSSGTTSQSYHDGILEVVGIYSSFHMAQLQVGISTPLKLGQAKVVDIHLKQKAPMQVDGEPWEQPPGVLKISISKFHLLEILLNLMRMPEQKITSRFL
ncbi:diacylglycerol kinase epsilon isoform X1 [Diabrotica virgifera virgifera]|uniref:Diacylglycerol kinase n=2 Tax=Diabrotica virgifera virgifera TaxID=50390 RepID=A0ABM5KPS2_DIAVI|nr:diacylglycerol kinase epsilon isoform X1 [Diabrotica virgifera virgifera]